MKLTNMKFRVESPEQSEELQRILFGLGYKWHTSLLKVARKTDSPILYTYDDGDITEDSDLTYFVMHTNKEVDTAAFIALHTTKKEENVVVTGTRLKHYDTIMAWASGAEVEVSCSHDGPWAPTSKPSWAAHLAYRVKPVRVFPCSSLTRQDLLRIVQETPGDFMDSYVAMADAAVARYIVDMEKQC